VDFFLHIGMQKAGSKAIQRFLGQNSDFLKGRGLDCALDLRSGIWHEHIFTNYDGATDEKLNAMTYLSPAAVLSFERAYAAPNQTIEALLSHCRSAKVIFFCREPVAWANSMKNQVLKAHRTRLSDWQALTFESGRYTVGLESGAHLERWEQMLGRSAIRSVAFKPQINVVPVFADWLGVPAETLASDSAPLENPNRALDAYGIRVMLDVKRRIIDTDDATHVEAVKLCHAVLSDRMVDTRTQAAPLLLTPEEIEECHTKFGHGMNSVLKRYGGGSGFTLEEQAPAMTCFTPTSEERDLAREIVARARANNPGNSAT
tara:strand:+ start:178516 stop:179466 length:951 start_codon:yes stop_codon:yes gene_type:complete